MRAKKTETLGDITRRVVERADPRGRRYGAKAVKAWNTVAGPDILRHTHGVSLRDGELVVFVDSAAWANELALMTDRFLAMIRSAIGEECVMSIRFTVSKRVSEKKVEESGEKETDVFYEADNTPSEPLSENERRQAAHIAAAVRDESLREAALRVMIKDLEWKKGVRAQKSSQTRPEGPRGGKSGS